MNGKPFQLDAVVHCRGIQTVRHFGAGAHVAYEQLPYLHGRPTQAQQVVLMRVPDYCRALYDTSLSEKAFMDGVKTDMGLPLVMFAPELTMKEGVIAFTSRNGYNAPGSPVRFISARFTESSYADWRSWKQASGRDHVVAWHTAGIAHGGTAIESLPDERPNGAFVAYLRDPDGNKLTARTQPKT